MKLASLATGRDGELLIVDRSLRRALAVPEIARTLQGALDQWAHVAPGLARTYELLNADPALGFALDPAALAAPLPRAYQWLDGSAYLPHIERARRARGAAMPPNHLTDPLMYQGLSDGFLGPCAPICVAEEAWGADFEAEIAVITDDVPRGATPRAAARHIRLLMLVNDISLRNLIPGELAKGFGFLQGKPASACSGVAVTPDELDGAWDGSRLHGELVTHWNGRRFGNPDPGLDMHFDFPALIAHAAKTRSLGAGTIIGSGTVSNTDTARGCSCIVERRTLEVLDTGEAITPFLRAGDRVCIEFFDGAGRSPFGAIEQEVRRC